MIKLLTEDKLDVFTKCLIRFPAAGARIDVFLSQYGLGCPDPLFYLYEDNKTRCSAALFGGRLLLCPGSGMISGELLEFIRFLSPSETEAPLSLCSSLIRNKDHDKLNIMKLDAIPPQTGNRVDVPISFSPGLDDIYSLLKYDRSGDIPPYDSWLCDTSHRIRHGLTLCAAAYLDNTPCSAVTVMMPEHLPFSFLSGIVTAPDMRGLGLSSSLVRTVCIRMLSLGRTPLLICREELCGFYRRIGFAHDGYLGRLSASDISPERTSV